MSRGSLPKSFTRWGSPREQTLGTSGRERMLTGRISRAYGLLWRSQDPSSLASSLRIRREGRKFSRCSPRLRHVQSLPEMRMLQIRQTAGGRFLERIILSGSSRGLSRRRRRNEDCQGRIKLDCNTFARFALLTFSATLVCQFPSASMAQGNRSPLIGVIHSTGQKRFTERTVIAASGLKPGQIFDVNAIEAATQKLGQSGAFDE